MMLRAELDQDLGRRVPFSRVSRSLKFGYNSSGRYSGIMVSDAIFSKFDDRSLVYPLQSSEDF
jgi:hypothetical protein